MAAGDFLRGLRHRRQGMGDEGADEGDEECPRQEDDETDEGDGIPVLAHFPKGGTQGNSKVDTPQVFHPIDHRGGRPEGLPAEEQGDFVVEGGVFQALGFGPVIGGNLFPRLVEQHKVIEVRAALHSLEDGFYGPGVMGVEGVPETEGPRVRNAGDPVRSVLRASRSIRIGT